MIIQTQLSDINLRFNTKGLIPAIAQASRDGRVLMMAWMNQQAFDKTLETGQAHFWSRSRQKLWRKGETSGNTLQVRSIQLDCDSDVLLLEVEAAGPACHTGARSCFFTTIATHSEPVSKKRENLEPEAGFSLESLYQTLLDRQRNPKPGSYTNQLLTQGEDEIVKKIGEEAVEIILAAKGQGNPRLVEEIADLTYHTLVLMVLRGLAPNDILAELDRRHAG